MVKKNTTNIVSMTDLVSESKIRSYCPTLEFEFSAKLRIEKKGTTKQKKTINNVIKKEQSVFITSTMLQFSNS